MAEEERVEPTLEAGAAPAAAAPASTESAEPPLSLIHI